MNPLDPLKALVIHLQNWFLEGI